MKSPSNPGQETVAPKRKRTKPKPKRNNNNNNKPNQFWTLVDKPTSLNTRVWSQPTEIDIQLYIKLCLRDHLLWAAHNKIPNSFV